MFPSFPRYKEGTGGRGQIEPGPPVYTVQKLTILIQNYYKVLQNLLCLQKLYYA
jgi:hypothetical protein